jgi:sodium/pantothenate symporter
VIMLVLALTQVGGLGNATKQLSEMTPPEFMNVVVTREKAEDEVTRVPRGSWLTNEEGDALRLKSAIEIAAGESASEPVEALRLTTPAEIEKVKAANLFVSDIVATISGEVETYAYGAGKPGVYTSTPGPSRDNPSGFITVLLAFSFFAFWNFSGAGQPSYMVRQMAFKDTLTLRRSMVMVAFYFAIIYFPLVIIFTCARVLLPGMEIYPDRVMPEMAAVLTNNAGMPWLAGLLVAAPFAAVMSSVDSFLLLVSSGVVRDIYQESINRNANDKQIKKLTYGVTVVVGMLGVVAVMHPPQFLQHLIVFASAGLGACFLMPMVFALYWRKATASGVVAGMLAGGLTVLALYLVGFLKTGKFGEYLLLGFHPFIWSVLVSTILIYVISLKGTPPAEKVQERFFGGA